MSGEAGGSTGGLTIVLGYAPLVLLLVDVPGHERFVRTMVAGASGIDLFLMVVAADDGVMPQTSEHAEVLRALAVATGVVAGDRLVIRRLAPPDTLGGGVVLDSSARRHGRRPDVLARLRRLDAGGGDPDGRPRRRRRRGQRDRSARQRKRGGDRDRERRHRREWRDRA